MTVTCTSAPDDNAGALMSVTPTPRCGGFQPCSGCGAERRAAGAIAFGLGDRADGGVGLVGVLVCAAVGLVLSRLLASFETGDGAGVAFGVGLGGVEALVGAVVDKGALGRASSGVPADEGVATRIEGVGKVTWTSPSSASE
ncbi:MAG: hypothetical protein Q8M73_11160 [Actinomycetota bacterium]|nr:hypothetical protein [Actinomycetota bacterium]